jgi:hypothetical protein
LNLYPILAAYHATQPLKVSHPAPQIHNPQFPCGFQTGDRTVTFEIDEQSGWLAHFFPLIE